ncbi:Hypothetical predicted protein [Podarcis lilfordi]|uniref:Secreted protein n=1 Tax=Podarcis lilfordi TaxID=74358 RepID=A0AA35KVI6_9SAUR|nr:Hypothetical predicted protein [Podarcis lilfordi]
MSTQFCLLFLHLVLKLPSLPPPSAPKGNPFPSASSPPLRFSSLVCVWGGASGKILPEMSANSGAAYILAAGGACRGSVGGGLHTPSPLPRPQQCATLALLLRLFQGLFSILPFPFSSLFCLLLFFGASSSS